MTDFPTLPDFLNRKSNGAVTPAIRETRTRAPRTKKAPARAVRIYIATRYRGLACGWNYVTIVKRGRKYVTVRPTFAGARSIRFPISIFERIWDKAP
jgi:hypothetical protein